MYVSSQVASKLSQLPGSGFVVKHRTIQLRQRGMAQSITIAMDSSRTSHKRIVASFLQQGQRANYGASSCSSGVSGFADVFKVVQMFSKISAVSSD
jgi:regulation of enolase protein 1 (concanavalin A-like superfamily)